MKANYRHEVLCKIERRPNLIPIFSHVLGIPERVFHYDNHFFVVFNKRNQKYEIHSLEYPEGMTISCTIPYDDLDERAMEHLWYNDIRVHGKEIFRRMELSEERARIRAERERKQFTRDFAREHRSEFAKDAWLL
jgi:hypothetical protein